MAEITGSLEVRPSSDAAVIGKLPPFRAAPVQNGTNGGRSDKMKFGTLELVSPLTEWMLRDYMLSSIRLSAAVCSWREAIAFFVF